jgi:hypothetical protein
MIKEELIKKYFLKTNMGNCVTNIDKKIIEMQ